MLSRGAITFVGSTVVVLGIVYAVHWEQSSSKSKMREGVMRDIERRKQKIEALATKESS